MNILTTLNITEDITPGELLKIAQSALVENEAFSDFTSPAAIKLLELMHLATADSNKSITSKYSILDDRFNYTFDREYSINNIKVLTSSGLTFDGDERSQERMSRAIHISAITGDTVTLWRLADNSDVSVTIDDLKEALALSGKELSKLWLDYN